MGEPKRGLKVLMLPWLAHGHISPFLQLAKKLSKRNIFIYLCSTPINLLSVTKKLSTPYTKSIKLVEINLPTLPNLPPHYHTTNGLPSHLMDTLKEAFKMSKPELLDIYCSLKPDFVIHDCAVMWLGEVAWSVGIPTIDFVTFSAAFISFYLKEMVAPLGEFPFDRIHIHEFENDKVLPVIGITADDFERVNPTDSCNLRLIKSSREIEGKYIDYVTRTSKRQVIPIGLLVDQEPLIDDDSLGLIQWLNKKEKRSCVFVSFGSEYFLTSEEIEEIAHGLELCNLNFIWVVRVPKERDGIKVEEVLPKGFFERVGDRGRVVEGWAPQTLILRHQSIGGLLSHCGWNSILESITFGVPIIAMPMHLDQPLNARLVVEVGVGLEIEREGTSGKVNREVVAKVIMEVAIGMRGDHVRRKVREISKDLMSKGEEEIDELTKRMIHINQERKHTI
ncbi:beta-D-glucosyl crocetin beta-1,6-glucosyltransferase-like [Rutidosis leptorrhynchoides]|uniref:beta-D-glucosyl crocetin beta-1,6-glucosyltransferase-like n=1 Tax=Rutidosis leptorrhynchoides TaxID=125765 RepID=UPI003A99D3A5